MNLSEHYPLIVAIDFGTSRSGFAYSWSGAAARETNYRTKWDDQIPSLISAKVPTLALYDRSDKLIAWGHSAARAVMESNSLEGCSLAKEFKMDLHTALGDVNGPVKTMDERLGHNLRTFPVVTLIADFLRKLKEAAPDDIRRTAIQAFHEQDILWCLTIPANWTAAEISWMRLAAHASGLVSSSTPDQDRLIFVLEPEAAARYVMEHERLDLRQGDRFMVLDCGGDKIKISIYKNEGTAFISLAGSTGEMCGSTYVNKALIEYVKEQVSKEAFENWRERDPVNSGNMLRVNIEIAKCGFGLAPRETACFELPSALSTFLEQHYPDRVKEIALAHGDARRLRMSPDIVANRIFGRVIDGVMAALDKSLQGLGPQPGGGKPLDYIFMVGGFSESLYLQEEIKKRLSQTCSKFLVPEKAGSAALLGAVSFALRTLQSPEHLSERIEESMMQEEQEALKKADDYLKDYTPTTSKDRANLVIAGLNGVGKSTLINSVFGKRLAKTGIGLPQTSKVTVIGDSSLPLQIYDTKGFEVKNSAETVAGVRDLVLALRGSPDPADQIHAAWLCILDGSNRVEQVHLDFLRLFKDLKVPCVVVLTQCYGGDDFLTCVRQITEEFSPAHVIGIVAEPYMTKAGTIPRENLDILVDKTLEVLPASRQRAVEFSQQVVWSRKLKKAHEQVNWAAAAGIAAAATPIPFTHSAALIGIEIAMMIRINDALGVVVPKSQVRSMVVGLFGIITATVGGKMLAAELLTFIPGVGTLAGAAIKATVAGSVTKILGSLYIDVIGELCEKREEMPSTDVLIAKLKAAFTSKKAHYVSKAAKPE